MSIYIRYPPIKCSQNTIVSEGFKGGTRGAPIMPRDAVSLTANVGMVGKNGLTAVWIFNSHECIISNDPFENDGGALTTY